MTGQGRPSSTAFAIARARRLYQHWASRAVTCLAVQTFLFVVAANVTTSGQTPRFEEPVRLRIQWGGGPAARWMGRIALERGSLAELEVAEGNADSSEIRIENNWVTIQSQSVRASERIDVSAFAARNAKLLIDLAPGADRQPLHAEVPLSEVVRKPYHLMLDDAGSALSIESLSSRVAIVTDRESLIFLPRERFSFEARLQLDDAAPGTTVDVTTTLSAAGGGDPLWTDRQRLSVPIDGLPSLVLAAQTPSNDGVYTFRIAATRPPGFRPGFRLPGTAAPLVERSFDIVVLGDAAPPSVGESQWESVLEIDPTNPRWWDRLPVWTQLQRIPGLNRGPLGSLRAAPIDHRLGRFIELPPTPAGEEPHWQAYSLPLEAAGVPHLLEVDYPADQHQSLGISIIDQSAAEPIGRAFDTGVYVEGLGLADVNTIQTHRIVFWPRSQAPLLLVTNQHPSAAAHFGPVRVLKRTGGRLASMASEQPAGERLVAAYIAGSPLAETLGVDERIANSNSSRPAAAENWRSQYESATRLADYLRFAGYNAGVVNLQGVNNRLAEDRISGTPTNPLQPDGLDLMLRVFNREQLILVPSLRWSTPVGELERLRARSDPQTSGLEWVGPYGQTWLQTFGARDGRAAHYNLLHPSVQQELLQSVKNLLDHYGGHAAFGGLAVQLSSDGYGQLPPPEWGLDDATVARFERDTGIAIRAAGSNRFTERCAALNGPYAAVWRKWRADQVSAFYQRLAALVRAGDGRRKLILSTESSFDHPVVKARILPKILDDTNVTDTLLDLGIDLAALETTPGVSICTTRYLGPTSPLQDRAIDLEVSQQFTAWRQQARGNPSPAVLLYHRAQPVALSSLAAKSPFRLAGNFQLVREPIAHQAALLQPYAMTLADADCQVLIDGGETLPLGSAETLRDARLVLQNLPTTAETSEFHQQPLVIRRYSEPDRVTLLVVNACPWRAEAQITLDLPQAVTMTPLVTPASDPAANLPQNNTIVPGGAPWLLSLAPYAVHAVQLDHHDVGVRNISVRISEAATSELAARLAQLTDRDPAPRVHSSVLNPGFEPEGEGAIPGWRAIVDEAGGTAKLDAATRLEGKTSLYLQSAGQLAAAESDWFPSPATGQFAMTVFIRGRNLAPAAELRMMLETDRAQPAYQRAVVIGGQRPGAMPLSEQWQAYPILVNDVPLESGTRMRVRFELVGSGEVWLDDAKTYALLFPLPFYLQREPEYLKFMKLIFAVEDDFNKGRYSDCVRRLDGYWPRFYTNYTPPVSRPVAQQPPEEPRAALAPANPPAEKRPGVGERLKQMWPFW